MKNQYVGDVNDYLKYSFLRHLARGHALGVVWMLTPSDGRNDGQRLAYLQQPRRFRYVDPEVFDAMRETVDSQRDVSAIERLGLFDGALYFAELVPDSETARRKYLQQAMAAVNTASLVFFDPDNGFGVRSVARGRKSSSKYLYWDEAAAFYARGQTVVAYQHFPRRARLPFLHDLAADARAATSAATVAALTTASVAFVVVPQLAHEELLTARLREFSRHASAYATAVLLDT